MKLDDFCEKERAALLRSPLFAQDAPFVLAGIGDARVPYGRGETVHPAGEPFARFGLLLSGALSVETSDLDGNRMVMAEVFPGDTFGESLSLLAVPSPAVTVVALAESVVLWLRADPFRVPAPDPDPRASALRARFSGMLARRTLAMNDRIQVLSKKTLREKIVTYLSFCARRAGSRTFTLPLDREGMAAYLGVNRSALSRELSAMQRAGILECYKNSFRML